MSGTEGIEEVLMGLNAITDNAKHWTPEQVAQHAQGLAGVLSDARKELLSALRSAAQMLSDVAGDIEDGGSLESLRGKYVMALVNARDDARSVVAKAEASK